MIKKVLMLLCLFLLGFTGYCPAMEPIPLNIYFTSDMTGHVMPCRH